MLHTMVLVWPFLWGSAAGLAGLLAGGAAGLASQQQAHLTGGSRTGCHQCTALGFRSSPAPSQEEPEQGAALGAAHRAALPHLHHK